MIDAVGRLLAPFSLPKQLVDAAAGAARAVTPAWQERDANAMLVSAKVMSAFADAGITDAHLQDTVGYGYHDFGREAYEGILARVMDAPCALARPQLTSGTQAIVATIDALAGEGGIICSLTGRPYDTLRLALVDHPHALRPGGAGYDEVAWPLDEASHERAAAALHRNPAVVFLQRSRGYAPRPSMAIDDIARSVALVRRECPHAAVVFDNCYGELVELREPNVVGADAVVGSLIKNPGGGVAATGAYVAGTRDVVDRVAERIFAPGIGTGIGPSLHTLRAMYAGLHRAARTVAESLKILDFAAALFAQLGYEVDPSAGAQRTDIIQAIRLGSTDKLRAFARGLQQFMPVNARAVPEPGPVPGYAMPVIMAGGAFITGSTIELSCDAPMREPYEVYLQGGMDVAHGIVATVGAAAALSDLGKT